MLLSPATKLGLREPPGSSHGHWEAVPLLDPATESVALTRTRGFLLSSRRRSSLYDRLRRRLLANKDQSSFPKTSPPSQDRSHAPGSVPRADSLTCLTSLIAHRTSELPIRVPRKNVKGGEYERGAGHPPHSPKSRGSS